MSSFVSVVVAEFTGAVLGTFERWSSQHDYVIVYRDRDDVLQTADVRYDAVVVRHVERRLGRLPTRLALVGPNGPVRPDNRPHECAIERRLA